MKAHPSAYGSALRGETLAMIFEKPSLRTRVSFDVGIQQLGGFSLYLSPAEINLGKRESVYDVAKNLERMVQGIMIRTFCPRNRRADGSVREHSRHQRADRLQPSLPGDGRLPHHLGGETASGRPEDRIRRRRQQRRTLADVRRSAGRSARLGGHASGLRTRRAIRWHGRASVAVETGGTCTVTNDPDEAASGADVIYTDVWASMGQEAEAEKRRHIFLPYQVDATLFRRAKPDAIFLHCLPAHRGDEVTDDVIDSPRSLVFQQAENRLHSQKAIMLELMKGEFVKLPGLVELQELAHI